MFWLFGSIVITALTVWFCYLKPFSYWKKLGVKQSKPWIFFGDSGSAIFRTKDVTEWINETYYMHPGSRYTGIYQFLAPMLLIKDPELLKQVSIKDFDHFTDHNTFSLAEDIDPLWGKNLFALKGQRWRDMRALLSSSFTSSKMKIMYALISDASQNFVQYFLSKKEDLIELEMKDAFTRYTNDVIASTSFGVHVDSLSEPNNEFYLMGKESLNFDKFSTMLKIIGYFFVPRLLKIFKITLFDKKMTKFFNNLIGDTIKIREEKGITRPDMINLLLEMKNGVKHEESNSIVDTGFAVVEEPSSEIVKHQKRRVEITNEDITSQAMLFFLAGFESVSTAMCFTAYELAVNPDVQEKLRKEIRETLRACNGKVTYEALLKMKYMDMIISESLRKYPPAPLLDRCCVKPYTIEPKNADESTVTLRKGDLLLVPTYSIHHDPEYYPEPEKFIPERFSDENKGNVKPCTYMPFGLGPRACIGSRFALLEIKAVLFHLLDKFEVVPVKETMIPLKMNKRSFQFLPMGLFPLGLKRL